MVGGKHGTPRRVHCGWRWAALAFVRGSALSGVPAVRRAAQRGVLAVRDQLVPDFHAAQCRVRVLRIVGDAARVKNTVPGHLAATIGTLLALVIGYVTARQAIAGHRLLGFLATAPVAIPGIVLGVGLFLSYTRPPFVLYGTLWILLIAFLTITLPAAYQQLQSAFATVHPELEDAGRILGATRLQALRHITAPLAAHQRDRDLVLHLRRRDPRAFRRHHPVHLADQGHPRS